MPQTQQQHFSQRLCRTIVLAGAATTGFSYAGIAYKAGGDKPLLSLYFSIGTVIAYGTGAVWVWSHLLNYFFTRDLVSYSVDTPGKVRHATTNFLAILASLPDAYAVYKFNSNNIGYGIWGFFSAYGYESLGFYTLSSRQSSLYLWLKKITGTLSPKQREIIKVQSFYQQKLLPSLFTSRVQKGEEHSSEEETTPLFSADNSLVHSSLTRTYTDWQEQFSKPKPHNYYLCRMLQAFFMLFPLGNVVTSIVLSDEVYEFTNYLLLRIILTIISVVPNLTLNLWATKEVVADSYDMVMAKCRGVISTSPIGALYPVGNIAMSLIALALAVASAADDSYVSYHTLEDKGFSVGLRSYLALSSFLSSVIFETFAMIEIFTFITLKVMQRYGEQNNSHFIQRHQALMDAKNSDIWNAPLLN